MSFGCTSYAMASKIYVPGSIEMAPDLLQLLVESLLKPVPDFLDVLLVKVDDVTKQQVLIRVKFWKESSLAKKVSSLASLWLEVRHTSVPSDSSYLFLKIR